MQAENGAVNHSSKWQVVKKLSKVDPNVGVSVLAEAFIVKAVHLGDLTHLVVTTKDS